MAVVWPLVDAASVYVAAVVRTQDKEKIEVVSAHGGVSNPVDCEDVEGEQVYLGTTVKFRLVERGV